MSCPTLEILAYVSKTIPRSPDFLFYYFLPVQQTTGGIGHRVCVRGHEKERMGCFLDGLRAFGINADQWTTAAQDEGKWRRTAEQGAEHFMAKWIAAKKTRAGLRHGVVCLNVTGNTKERIAQSKRARAGSLALVD